MRGFFDCSSRHVTISCYLCFVLCVFVVVCMCLLIVLADGPTLVAMCVIVFASSCLFMSCAHFVIVSKQAPVVALCVFLCLMRHIFFRPE